MAEVEFSINKVSGYFFSRTTQYCTAPIGQLLNEGEICGLTRYQRPTPCRNSTNSKGDLSTGQKLANHLNLLE